MSMAQRPIRTTTAALPHRNAVRFIVLLGIVSLLADVTYEGARSITGPFLAVLGASAAVVGIASGFGELVGFAVRLGSGYVSDRTGRYWAMTIAGYALNLFAVPLLAFADQWHSAAVLIVAERVGRAIRTPARDAMLSSAASQTGLGWGFGLHEALDQIGAVIGPLALSAALFLKDGYRMGFAMLIVPAVLCMGVLLTSHLLYPRPQDLDLSPPALTAAAFPRAFWVYVAGSACIAAGYADFPLIAFHFERVAVVSPAWIPTFYAIAMAAGAIAALLLGRLFDRIGIGSIILATVCSALSVPLAFLGGSTAAAMAMVLWGIGMGAQESVMRAAVARLAPAQRRATAYGLFNGAYGAAWFAGSVLLGILYDHSIGALVVLAMALQAAAIPILWRLRAIQNAVNPSGQQHV